MTQRPEVLTDSSSFFGGLRESPASLSESPADLFRPNLTPTVTRMDPLSDVLRAVRLNGAYFYHVQAAAPWSVSTTPARDLVPRILPEAEHLISYHILLSGTAWGGLEGEDQVARARRQSVTRTRCCSDPRIVHAQRPSSAAFLAATPGRSIRFLRHFRAACSSRAPPRDGCRSFRSRS